MKKVFCIKLQGKRKFLRLFGSSSKEKGLVSGFVALKPGKSVGLHNTKNKEEALIILKGRAQVCCGKNPNVRKVKAISFVYIPPKTDHDIKNIGKGVLRYVYLTASV